MFKEKNDLLVLLLAMPIYFHLSSAQTSSPPNPTGRFMVWFRNETTLSVLWQPPFPAGIFNGYKASISPEDAIKSSVYVPRVNYPPSPAQTAFNGLVPGKAYNISVQTVNGDLESEAKIAQYRTVPSQPTNVTITNIESNGFDVLWNEPSEVSEFDRYQVFVKSIGSIKILPLKIAIGSLKYNLNQTIDYDKPLVASFDNLHPGQTYKVFVKSFSGKVASWPATADVTTRPLPVSNFGYFGLNQAGRVMLDWTPNTDSIQDSFKIEYVERKTFEPDSGSIIMEGQFTPGKNIEYTLNKLIPERNYIITMKAISNGAESVGKRIIMEDYPMYIPAEDSQPLDSFYYTDWEDTIYDAFDYYGDRIPLSDVAQEAAHAKVDGTVSTTFM